MSENNNPDFSTMMDQWYGHLERTLGNLLADQVEEAVTSQVEEAVTSTLQDALPEALHESLSHFEFQLPDGTMVRPRQYMKLLSPDKSKQLLCYGGLRVDGCSLIVQTYISCWETIAVYPSREDAIAALLKVKEAMDSGASAFAL